MGCWRGWKNFFEKFKVENYDALVDTLQALLDFIGLNKKDEAAAYEFEQIFKSDRLRESDAEFLIAVGKIDEAEVYLLKCADQFDGNHYSSLLSPAETRESENRHLVTSLIYRSLLISILEHGYTKAYPHGIKYLKKLDKLAVRQTGDERRRLK